MKIMDSVEIIKELDKTVIGQKEAKIVIANAFRDRVRRGNLPPTLRKWVTVKNILLKGESGTGKTELARQVADLCGCPFVTVDATTLTASGYYGGDISEYVRNLLKQGEKMYPKVVADYKKANRPKKVEEKYDFVDLFKDAIEILCAKINLAKSKKSLRQLEKLILAGVKSGNIDVDINLSVNAADKRKDIVLPFQFKHKITDVNKDQKLKNLVHWLVFCYTANGAWALGRGVNALTLSAVKELVSKLKVEMLDEENKKFTSLIKSTYKKCNIVSSKNHKPSPAEEMLADWSISGMDGIFSPTLTSSFIEDNYDMESYTKRILGSKEGPSVKLPPELKDARTYTENYGIMFIDEIDKLVPTSNNSGISNTGVQYELLRVLEGGEFNLDSNNGGLDKKLGSLKTDNILFICAGAFVNVSEEGLISEVRGRLPISVTLHPLTSSTIVDILKFSNKSPLKEAIELYKVDGVKVTYDDAAIERLAALSAEYNRNEVNLGARRIVTFLHRVITHHNNLHPVAKEIKITTKLVEDALTKYYEDNLHQFKIPKLEGDIDTVVGQFKSPHTSPLIPYRNLMLLKGKNYFISNPEYRLLAATARAIQWYNDDYELLTREACKAMLDGDSKYGTLTDFICKNMDKLIPPLDEVKLMNRDEITNALIISAAYKAEDNDHSKLIVKSLEEVATMINAKK